MFFLDVESINVVHLTIERFSHNRQGPRLEKSIVLCLPLDDGIPDDANALRVGNHHRTLQESGFFDPGSSRHLTVAIESKPSGKDRIFRLLAARQVSSHAGSDRTNTDV